MLLLPSILVAVTTFVLLQVLLTTGAALKLAADTPNQRSLHTKITPRIGGIVIMPVALLASIFIAPEAWLLPTLALLLCIGSFMDDRMSLPIGLRFLAHILAAAVLVLQLPLMGVLTALICGFLIVWMTNLCNFMDGSDGLIGGMSVIGFSAFAYAAWAVLPIMAVVPLFVVVATCAFLWFNFPPARVFMGDAGSIPIGFLAGGIGVSGWWSGMWPWWFPILVFSPFILDASVTLLRRILQGKRFWQAHREHYYQRLILMGWSHRRLVLCEYVAMSLSSAAALMLLHASLTIQLAGLTGAALIYGILMLIIDMQWKTLQESKAKND